MLYFDIGANIGRWALANVSSDITIVSVEASPRTYQQLVQNVQQIPNIIPLHYAVTSSSEPTITFYHCKVFDTISTLNKDWLTSPESRFGNYKNTIEEFNVPTISLDTLIESYGVPDLLKIDVEGAENVVIASLSKQVPEVCFEWAAEMVDVNIECIHMLVRLGFTKFAIQSEDNYTYRPTYNKSLAEITNTILNAKPKHDWGMVWARCD